MKASEFLVANAGKSLAQWENNAVLLAQQDSFVSWPMVPIAAVSRDGRHTGTFYVASDYLALGTSEDFIRLPLTPATAQRIANSKAMLLPTSKMVEDIWRSSIKLTPQPQIPNKGANLAQYAAHSQAIDEQLRMANISPLNAVTPISGQKKDIIISNIWKPGKVVIFGWYKPDGSHIQPKSNIHGDFYVDYSHGVRLVSPNMEIDGQPMSTEEVLKNPEYAGVLSDEGPLTRVRYPTPSSELGPEPVVVKVKDANYYTDLGLSVLIALSRNAA